MSDTFRNWIGDFQAKSPGLRILSRCSLARAERCPVAFLMAVPIVYRLEAINVQKQEGHTTSVAPVVSELQLQQLLVELSDHPQMSKTVYPVFFWKFLVVVSETDVIRNDSHEVLSFEHSPHLVFIGQNERYTALEKRDGHLRGFDDTRHAEAVQEELPAVFTFRDMK